MNIFFEIHKDLPREGPGNNKYTARAFSSLSNLPANPHILDVGCGPGMQTLELARLSGGNVTALDNHQPYLDQLSRNATKSGLDTNITTMNGDMSAMGFAADSFDCIWSEGAIYIIGFEEGLKQWKRFLKPGGYIAVTHIAWLKPDPPKELFEFWNAAYPAIRNIGQNLKNAQDCGYAIIDHFALPEDAWWDYYTPIEIRVKELREKFKDDNKAMAQLDEEEFEIELYRKYSDWYGYVFFVMRKGFPE